MRFANLAERRSSMEQEPRAVSTWPIDCMTGFATGPEEITTNVRGLDLRTRVCRALAPKRALAGHSESGTTMVLIPWGISSGILHPVTNPSMTSVVSSRLSWGLRA